MPISLTEYWMGRDKAHAAELTDLIRQNAAELCARVSQLQKAAALGPLYVSSGWRPVGVNSVIPNAAKKSNHLLGQAVDLKDPDGKLGRWALNNLDRLAAFELWLEHPSKTKGWVHLQSVPPKSGKRVFLP